MTISMSVRNVARRIAVKTTPTVRHGHVILRSQHQRPISSLQCSNCRTVTTQVIRPFSVPTRDFELQSFEKSSIQTRQLQTSCRLTFSSTSLLPSSSSLPIQTTTTGRRFKQHSAKMGHRRDTLEELAHRPEREAAQERRQKKKDRKAAKKSNKKGGGGGDAPAAITKDSDGDVDGTETSMNPNDFDDDEYDDDHDDDDDDHEGNDDEEPSLPDPEEVKQRMMVVVERFEDSLRTIRGAEPTPEMFDDVQVNAYGSMTPLKAVGQVVIVSNTLAQITCFDPSVAKDVQKAIQLSLELNPQTGDEPGLIRVPLPRVSMEVREQTAKLLQKKHESVKQRIRKVRRKAMDIVKKGKDGKLSGISKDDAFSSGKEVDDVTEQVIGKLKEIVDAKMDSIMAV